MIHSELLINHILFIISLAGFCYGLKKFIFRSTEPGLLYPRLVTCGFGAFMMGRLHEIVSSLVTSSHNTQFNFGLLGTVSCFLFLFTANYGISGGIAGRCGTGTKRSVILPLLAPVLNIAICLPVFFSEQPVTDIIICLALLIVVIPSSYLNLKLAFFPGNASDAAASVKGYNFTAALFSFFTMAEQSAHFLQLNIAATVSHVGICVCVVLSFLLLGKGVKTWTA